MDALEALNTRSSAKTYGDTAPSRDELAIVLQDHERCAEVGALENVQVGLRAPDRR